MLNRENIKNKVMLLVDTCGYLSIFKMLPNGKICLSTYILSAMVPVTHTKKILKIQMPKLTELGNLKIT